MQAVATNSGHLGSNLGRGRADPGAAPGLRVARATPSCGTPATRPTSTRSSPVARPASSSSARPAGLSGYPSREESRHDYVENSHASTILSYAYGLACARDAGVDDHRHIVAVIGDGSMTGGMAYEALNNLGHSGRKVIIILNDNGRSYAPTVSNLSDSLTTHPAEPGLHAPPAQAGGGAARPAARRSPGREGLGGGQGGDPGVREPARVLRVARRALRRPGRRPQHRGRWSTPCATPPSSTSRSSCTSSPRRAAATRPRRTTTRSTSTTRRCSTRAPGRPTGCPPGYTQAFAEAILKEAELDPRLVAITAAMPGPTGLIPFQDRFPDRFYDVGIAEQHAVTAAAGMAMGGLRPVVADLLDVPQPGLGPGRVRRRAPSPPRGVLPRPRRHHRRRRPVAPRRVRHGPAHQGARHDGVRPVVGPGAPGDAARSPRLCDGPAAIRWPKGQARQVDDHEVGARPRRPRCVREGSGDVCVIAVGKMVANAAEGRVAAGRGRRRRRPSGTPGS